MFTPAGTRSSIVTFYSRKTPNDLRSALGAANVDVTVRDNGQVRVSPALFNTTEEVDRFLAVARRL
jgi:selenocysteine lyase/cysteine desulfurase